MAVQSESDPISSLLEPAVESALVCIGCGACTASCPAGRVSALRIRRAVENVARGRLNEVFADEAIWLCTSCITCTERCPRGVRIDEIVLWARNRAWPLHEPNPGHLKPLASLQGTGHLVPPLKDVEETREKMGLSPRPPTAAFDAPARQQVRKLLSGCRLPACDAGGGNGDG